MPQWEPLTPELVEEEAIRGDIVLRGAVILLALLFGWTKLADSSLLVQIRNGQELMSKGILPPRMDSFSSSATDHPWNNLSWLGDLWLAALYSIGNVWTLTIWSAIAAATAFWMIGRTSRDRSPTWWNSIVAAMALVAVFPWLTAGPTLFTVLGTAWLLWRLHRTQHVAQPKLWLWLAPAFWLWANVDPFAWIGLAILWAYAIGAGFRRGEELSGEPQAAYRKSLLTAAVASTIAAMVHPFHWHVLESPYLQYAVKYPEILKYRGIGPYFDWMWYSPLSDRFWLLRDIHATTAIALAVLSLLTMLMNLRRLNIGHALVWLVANGAAAGAGEMLPVSAIVNAVLAGLNAEAWYAHTFRQTYTVAWTELLFSRGGRAATVFAFFGLAYLMMNGALTGPDGRRLGMGFDWRLATTISSYQKLIRDSYDDRPFNGRVEHGDVLIWLRQKPFVDSRLVMYASGPSNLLDTHRAAFRAMMPAMEVDPQTGKPEVWKKTFDQYKLSQVFTRLTGDDIDSKYRLLLGLLLNPELKLTRLGGAAAAYCRYDSAADPAVRAYVDKEEGTAFVKHAFRGDDRPEPPGAPGWPSELTTYDRWLIQPEQQLPEDAQLAEHYEFLSNEVPSLLAASQGPVDVATALRVLAVRHARAALRLDPNVARANRLLGRVYRQILAQERAFTRQVGVELPSDYRVSEMLAGSYSALLTSPNRARDHEEVAQILRSVNYLDAAQRHLKLIYDLTGRWTALSPRDERFAEVRDANRDLYREINEAMAGVDEQTQQMLDNGDDVLAVAQSAVNAGAPDKALQLLTDHETDLVQNPLAPLMQGQLLMAVGRTEDGSERLESFEMSVPKGSEVTSIWRNATAFSRIAHGDYDGAINLWKDDLEQVTQSRIRSLLDTFPLQSTLDVKHDLYGATRGMAAMDMLYTFPERFAIDHFHIALAAMEQGKFSIARSSLKSILDHAPNCSLRPLVVYYHFLLTGEALKVENPEFQIPVWDGMFAPDDSAEPAASPPADDPPASEPPKTDAPPQSAESASPAENPAGAQMP